MAKAWEAGFKAAVKEGRVGWNVTSNNGRVQLKITLMRLRIRLGKIIGSLT